MRVSPRKLLCMLAAASVPLLRGVRGRVLSCPF